MPGQYDMPTEFKQWEGMKLDKATKEEFWEGPLPVSWAIMPRTPPVPITEITEDVFSEQPTNPRTPLDTLDKPFKAYEPELSHQVEMTLEESDGHQVEMVPNNLVPYTKGEAHCLTNGCKMSVPKWHTKGACIHAPARRI